MGSSSVETTPVGISFLIKSIKRLPFLSRSRQNGAPNPSKENCLSGKELSNLDNRYFH